MNLPKLAPWVAAGLAVAGAALMLRPQPPVRDFDVEAFGHLPVLEGGRVKPVDTLARNALLLIRGQQSFSFDPAEPLPGVASAAPTRQEAHTVGADEWLLDVIFRPDVADRQKIFVINNAEVLGLMQIQQTSDRYYAFATLRPYLGQIQQAGQAAQQKEAKERSPYENGIANLYERAVLYSRLKNTVELEGTPGLAVEIAAAREGGAGDRQQQLDRWAYFRPFSAAAGRAEDGWKNSGEALQEAAAGMLHPALGPWARMSIAYKQQDAAAFNKAAADATAAADRMQPHGVAQAAHELVFNRAQPFYVGMVIYVLALLAVFLSWLWKPEIFRPAAYGFLVAGALVHTAGLVSRVLLQGRPPVTNLYSSAVFVGWGAVVLGTVIEWLYRRGFGTAVASAAGFASLIVAHHLTGDGDTMEMMRAVLDSNFWLATHVVTITIGYAGTYLAGALAIGWVIWRLVVPNPDQATTKVWVSMAYGVICFALFFSFVGTVLGGIWADQSWGRFWGWDPKENGALLIVLWNAIILHARWGGFARERGTMAMAVFGNVITSLSWFGVNMLGVGLHSYGFMDKAFWALTIVIGIMLAFMAAAFLPAGLLGGLFSGSSRAKSGSSPAAQPGR
jgi:ABC-type transport system involved in cytochrome c biogenesis permease subunit